MAHGGLPTSRHKPKRPLRRFGSSEKFTSGVGCSEEPDHELLEKMREVDPDAGSAMTEQDRINLARSQC